MPWKKDLVKLKHELGKDETPPAKAPAPPKAAPETPASRSIEEEDAIFLSAMGLRPKGGRAKAAAPAVEPQPAPLVKDTPPEAGQTEFKAAMGDLKGIKPVKAESRTRPPAPKAPANLPAARAAQGPVRSAPAAAAASEPPATAAAPPPEGPAAPTAPPQIQINLAAGMAIVVDGHLDLRGHDRTDAEERLKERILDGYALGWRTLHVVVGSSEELRQMVLELLKTSAGGCISRYAQAPVPMGGPQAWILYFRGPAAPEN